MWYWILRIVLVALGKAFFRFEVKGRQNLPTKTNFIIVANHVSFLDGLAVMAAVPHKIHCIALRHLYRIVWFQWFLLLVETLPSGSASHKATQMLLQNRNVGLFPEGGISRDGRLREFRKGAALLAYKTGRPIVPCAVFGTSASLPYGRRLPRPGPIKVEIGKPIYLLKEFDTVIDDVRLQEGIFRVRNAIKEMLNAVS
jgi:1-acyl-sn-glycerol-3-phosphate acyltransferase